MRKPSILLLVDKPEWAFDFIAKAIAERLGDEYNFIVQYVIEKPDLAQYDFDLLYIFWWGETYHNKFDIPSKMVIKEVASHRWEKEEKYGRLKVEQFIERHLAEVELVTVVSERLFKRLSPNKDVMLAPRGFNPNIFYNLNNRNGGLKIGWAGNIKDKCKGVKEIIKPALFPFNRLHIAKGDLNYAEMCGFYNSLDIICVASIAEGEPIILTEAMACGCFPVTVDVGIVPELIEDKKNGLIVERNPQAFREAFKWCKDNLEMVRSLGNENSQMMLKKRTWDNVIPYWRKIFNSGLKISDWDNYQERETSDN